MIEIQESIDLSKLDEEKSQPTFEVITPKSCGDCNHVQICLLYINVAKMIESLSQSADVLDENVVKLSPQLAVYCKKYEEVVKTES